jgi:peroxiredoxin
VGTIVYAPATDEEEPMIKVGDRMPSGTVSEFIVEERAGCTLGPNQFKVEEMVKGKKIAIFGLPGAFTPTCSAKHLPGYIQKFDALRARGVDEIWCLSVNDAFVMGAWGQKESAAGKVRMIADGAGVYTKALGLEVEIPGMGLRSRRYSMLIDDGVVKTVNLEQPGKYEVSDADTFLKQIS